MTLNLKDIKTELPFQVRDGGSSISSSTRERYAFDFDVFLETFNRNLQRENVWTLKQRSEFIISILKGRRIPYVSVIRQDFWFDEQDRGRIQVIDGKQRLTAYFDFIDGKFPIEFNGKKYFFDDLDEAGKSAIENFTFNVDEVIDHTSNDPMHDHRNSKTGFWKFITDEDKINWYLSINFTGTIQSPEYLRGLEKLLKK